MIVFNVINLLMVSVVIRNKNEGIALENVLTILTKIYVNDIDEIIIVDNNSDDNSISIAKMFNCKIVLIDDFSYGRATNLGIMTANSKYILLLSSHAVPIGSSFFKNSIQALQNSNKIAGIRYINSIENYNRAISNDFKVNEPLKFGLMTGCAIVNKEVWLETKFDENLVFSEDKEWSDRVMKKGYEILDLNETFFYFIKRDQKSSLSRYKYETISDYLFNKKKYFTTVVILFSFIKKILFVNTIQYFKIILYDFKILKVKLEIQKYLKKNG